MRKPVVFLDKDGTLVQDLPYNVDPRKLTLEKGVADGLRRLGKAGFRFVVVTNQAGVARGYFAEPALQAVEEGLRALLLREAGVTFDAFYYCPHFPQGSVPEYAIACDCRKPRPGMLLRASQEWGIDLSQAWMVGDILNDVEAGRRAGCRTVLIDNGNETEWLPGPYRQPHIIAPDFAQASDMILENLLLADKQERTQRSRQLTGK
jgi:D-glycero-D-manno-heptose 1,7-bisphosphate phosphatase